MAKPLEGPAASPAAARTVVGVAVAGRWLTRANALTFVRLALAPVCGLAVLHGRTSTAGVVFALAVLTDLADGRVARRRGEASALGAKLDHATDALFVSIGLAALARLAVVPLLLPPLVLLAFAQYAIDSRALVGAELRASRLGRWNGVAYFVLLGIPVVRDALSLAWPGPGLVMAIGWLLVASTLVSMFDRARKRFFSA